MKRIFISAGNVTLPAELNDTPTARLIWDALPIEATAHTWGDEIYFDVPVSTAAEEDARTDVQVGELGYWPMGPALCIFFGPTPASTDQNPRAYSPVTVVGHVLGDATRFRSVRDGAPVRVVRAEQ